MKKVDAILHPVRLRIIKHFLGGQKKTAKELSSLLKDIPPASLYRHLDTLVTADVLQIAAKNQIRGTVEKVYILNNKATTLTAADISETTKEEHYQYFLFFMTQLLADFESYLKSTEIDFERDGAGYRQDILYLTDVEFQEVKRELKAVIERAREKYSPGARQRLVSTIIIPVREGEEGND